jgi:hypothetical protein
VLQLLFVCSFFRLLDTDSKKSIAVVRSIREEHSCAHASQERFHLWYFTGFEIILVMDSWVLLLLCFVCFPLFPKQGTQQAESEAQKALQQKGSSLGLMTPHRNSRETRFLRSSSRTTVSYQLHAAFSASRTVFVLLLQCTFAFVLASVHHSFSPKP